MPITVLILAMVGFQAGAAVAKTLFPLVGAAGTASLRLAFAAVMLWAVWRPWRMRLGAREVRTLIVYGLALGAMNCFFYVSLRSIPLGIAVALEFAGPLALAMATSRRPLDFLWILLAALGLLALLPLGWGSRQLAPSGVACALAAGACWAIYIVFGRRAGAAHGGAMHAGQTTAIGMLIGALLIVPIGIAGNGAHLFSPAILPVAFVVALLSSALPYSMEMFAMPRLSTRTVGVLMSLDPALGALSGLWFLGEKLTAIQWMAIAGIMIASAGSAVTGMPEAKASRIGAPSLPE